VGLGSLTLDDGAKGPGDLHYWAQTIDGVVYGCWYRLRDDDQIEVFARGHRVVVPKEAIALLPEAVARAVLAQLRSRAGFPYDRDEQATDERSPHSGDAASHQE